MDLVTELADHVKDLQFVPDDTLSDKRSPGIVHTVDVLIIGTGIAGLAAARRLKELNITNFHLLEGRDRIGGRIATTTFQDVEVCKGPVYVHGHANNIVVKFVKKLGIAVHPPNHSDSWSRPFAARVSSSGENVADQVAASIEKHRTAQRKLMNTQVPPTDDSAATIMAECGWDPISPVDCVYDFAFYDLFNGLPAHYVSAYAEQACSIFEEDCSEYFLAEGDGYLRIVRHLASEAGLTDMPSKLTLSAVVNKIVWGNAIPDDKVEVHAMSNGVHMRWKAKHVVVAVPPTLLISHPPAGTGNSARISFEPQLPTSKQAAFSQIALVDYCRVLVAYEYCFWDQVDIILRVDDLQPTSTKWKNNDRHHGRKFPYWQNLSNFMPRFKDKAVLCTMVTGYWAEACSKMTAEELAEEVGAAMAQMYPNKANVAKKPLAVKLIRWRDDPFCLGAFAMALVGFNNLLESALGSSISTEGGKGGFVHFAGDAYRLDYLGTVQGAYLSGSAAANAIAESMLSKHFALRSSGIKENSATQ
ncbi:hypothetical protein AAHC03_01099 [Spirometra sp. Aus1]